MRVSYARNPGLPILIARVAKRYVAAYAGHKDGKRGIPYEWQKNHGNGLNDEGHRTTFMLMIEARASRARAKVIAAFSRRAERERGALLQASHRVISLSGELKRLTGDPAPDQPQEARYPWTHLKVEAARRGKSRQADTTRIQDELTQAGRALAKRLSTYEASVRRRRADVIAVNHWGNEIVACYRQALERSYIRRQQKAGPVSAPPWNPPPITWDPDEEEKVLAEDIISLLPSGVRDVVTEALKHIGTPREAW